MLKRFEVSNYKNFKDKIVVDFTKVGGYQFSKECVNEGTIGKMLIYGLNAVGKTNLGRGMGDITFVFDGVRTPYRGSYINVDNIDDDNSAKFCYCFQLGIDEIVYKYSKISVSDMSEESLIVNGNQVFYCNFEQNRFDFDGLSLIGAETAITERYMSSVMSEDDEELMTVNKMPFIRFLLNNVPFSSDSVILRLADYVKRMKMISLGGLPNVLIGIQDKFFDFLLDDDELRRFEKFLNVMGVECRLACKKLPDGRSELYLVHKKLITFRENASSGTLALMNLYRRLLTDRGKASFIYFDEFDAFYHYEMSRTLIEFLKMEYPECQIILTTHNTNLMSNRFFRPDCLFILSRDGRLTALSDATNRELREGHNLEKMYISGEFDEYE